LKRRFDLISLILDSTRRDWLFGEELVDVGKGLEPERIAGERVSREGK
jgi:hypothetical protein